MKKSLVVLFFVSLIFTVVIFLPYSVNISNGVSNVIDPLFYAWNLSYNAEHMFGGMSRSLNTNIFYPLTNTLSFSDTLWGQSIITSPIIWLTGNPILAENIAVLLSFPLASLSMYLLSFFLTKNRVASFLSGIFFAFSYPRLSQIGHLPMITSQWLPLYILALLQFLKEGKQKQLLLLCFWYLLSIASSIYFGVFLIPVTAVILLVDFAKRLRDRTVYEYKKRFLSLFPSVLVFLVLLTIIMFPYIRLRIEHPELKRSIDDMTHLRARPIDYISVLPTSLFVSHLPEQINEHVLYPTISVMLLAFLGVILSWKRRRYPVILFLGIGLTAFMLSLGDQQGFDFGSFSTGTLRLPYHYLYTYVPLFQAVRVPARFSIFVILSLSALSAFGMKEIYDQKRFRWAVSVFAVIFLMEIWQVKTPFVAVPSKASMPDVYHWVKQQPEPLIIAELPISLFYHGNPMEDQLYIPYDKLRKEDIYALETYRVYFSSFHKKRMLDGYSGFLPDTYNKLAEMLERFPEEHTIIELQKNGFSHIVFHSMQYDADKKEEILSALKTSTLVTPVFDNSVDVVYQIHKNLDSKQ